MKGVRVTRDGTSAAIDHDLEPMLTVRIELGVRASTLTDQEIIDRCNHRIGALGAALVPSPQLRWDEALGRWTPSGNAIRCEVEGVIDDPTVFVDAVELSVSELGAMLVRHGAQICLVFLDE